MKPDSVWLREDVVRERGLYGIGMLSGLSYYDKRITVEPIFDHGKPTNRALVRFPYADPDGPGFIVTVEANG